MLLRSRQLLRCLLSVLLQLCSAGHLAESSLVGVVALVLLLILSQHEKKDSAAFTSTGCGETQVPSD